MPSKATLERARDLAWSPQLGLSREVNFTQELKGIAISSQIVQGTSGNGQLLFSIEDCSMEAVVLLMVFGTGFGAGYFTRQLVSQRRRRRRL